MEGGREEGRISRMEQSEEEEGRKMMEGRK
jgi:hypothetical protein